MFEMLDELELFFKIKFLGSEEPQIVNTLEIVPDKNKLESSAEKFNTKIQRFQEHLIFN